MSELVKRNSLALADSKGEWQGPRGPKTSDDSVDDLYRSFVRKATSLERLTPEDETELGKQIQATESKSAVKKLVTHNMRLAIKMAHQYRREWTNLMDLVQEALAGLTIAAQKWDPDRGTKFGTYAVFWIRAQLTKFLMTNARLIHTANTRAGRKVYFSLPEVRRKLLASGKEASIEAIAEAIDEDPKEVALIVSRLQGKEASLSTPLDESGATTLQDALESEESSPESLASENEMQSMLANIIAEFERVLTNERDKAVWKEHLISHEPKSLVELGSRYGVSKQRMGQIGTRLKKRFRQHVMDALGPHTQLSWLFNND